MAHSRLTRCIFTCALVLAIPTSLWANEPCIVGDETVHNIVSEPLSLSLHFHFPYKTSQGSIYREDWPVEICASQVTGIALKNVTPDFIEDGDEALNLLLASGNLPDIIGGTHIQEQFNKLGPDGLLHPLNDLIEEHAPHIHQYFKENPSILNAVSASDGKLYFIPYIPDGKFGRAYFMRTDWLKKLNMSIPQTVGELYTVLKAFKTKDPNGNGLQDEIPFFARDFEELIRLVTLWDGRTTGTDTWHEFYVKDDVIRHGYAEENFRTGIENLAKWYKEGLIDAEIFERTGDIRAQLLHTDLGGMTRDWFASTASYNKLPQETNPDFLFQPIAPPASVSGKRVEEHRRTAVKPDGWAISTHSRHVIETIKYFDFWYTPAGRQLANFGVLNNEYTMQDGKPVFTQEVLEGDQPVNSRLWSVGAQLPRGFVQDYNYEKQWTNDIALAGIELYEQGNYLLEPFHGVTMNNQEEETHSFYWTDIKDFMLERQQDWITGRRDVNKDWDSYVRQLDKMGLQKVIKVMQSAYDRQYKGNLSAELAD